MKKYTRTFATEKEMLKFRRNLNYKYNNIQGFGSYDRETKTYYYTWDFIKR